MDLHFSLFIILAIIFILLFIYFSLKLFKLPKNFSLRQMKRQEMLKERLKKNEEEIVIDGDDVP